MDPGSQGPGRWSRLGIAISVVGLGGFVAGLWVPLRDALDAELPTREVVAEHAACRASATWPFSVPEAIAGREQAAIAALSVLSPAYAQLVLQFGGRLQLTTLAALSTVNTSVPRELSHVVGLYVPSERLILLAHDADNIGWTALHEVGHLVDHALGDRSAQPDFVDVFDALRSDERLDTYARSHPRECFAELFARYYFSDRRREHLAERFPEALQYMRRLEQRVLTYARVDCGCAECDTPEP